MNLKKIEARIARFEFTVIGSTDKSYPAEVKFAFNQHDANATRRGLTANVEIRMGGDYLGSWSCLPSCATRKGAAALLEEAVDEYKTAERMV